MKAHGMWSAIRSNVFVRCVRKGSSGGELWGLVSFRYRINCGDCEGLLKDQVGAG
jgi:hypothetical protein